MATAAGSSNVSKRAFKLLSDFVAPQNTSRTKTKGVKRYSQAHNQSWLSTIMTIMTLGMSQQQTQGRRPFIKVCANGSVAPWLFDTGAEVCCMSVAEFRNISVNRRPPKMAMYKELRCASSNKLQVKGAYLMDLNVLGRPLQQIVYV